MRHSVRKILYAVLLFICLFPATKAFTQLEKDYTTHQVRVDEIMLFTGANFQVFCNNFLTDFDWLAGKGEYGSNYNPTDEDGQTLSHDKLFGGAYPDELAAWRKQYFTIGILCINTDTSEMIVVDPEGYDYARYVGFPC